jgi:hypothetical protein
VQHDLGQDFFVAEIRAFAILSKLFMAPLWNCLESRDVDMVRMNRIYTGMVAFLASAAQNPASLLQGESPFPEEFITHDKWFEKVFRPSPRYDASTISALGVLLPALHLFATNHFKDHLEGGRHHDITSDQVKGVPLHNKLCERVFGYWDWLQQSKSNITSLAAEAYTLYAMNRTSTWLQGLDSTERNRVISDAKRDTNALRKKFKERQEKIRVEREAMFAAQKEASRQKELQVDAMIRLMLSG